MFYSKNQWFSAFIGTKDFTDAPIQLGFVYFGLKIYRMSIFQKSVLNKFLKGQDESKVEAAFEKLKLYRSKKEQIKGFNEEVFQDGFLKEIFVDVFGYKLNTIDKENYNLVREKKNVSDSKKQMELF